MVAERGSKDSWCVKNSVRDPQSGGTFLKEERTDPQCGGTFYNKREHILSVGEHFKKEKRSSV